MSIDQDYQVYRVSEKLRNLLSIIGAASIEIPQMGDYDLVQTCSYNSFSMRVRVLSALSDLSDHMIAYFTNSVWGFVTVLFTLCHIIQCPIM